MRRVTGKGTGNDLDQGAAYVNEADVYETDHERE